jgi:hypothetical protein
LLSHSESRRSRWHGFGLIGQARPDPLRLLTPRYLVFPKLFHPIEDRVGDLGLRGQLDPMLGVALDDHDLVEI